MSGMGSMMSGMMAFGWIGGLLILALIIGAVMLLAKEPGGSGWNLALTALAVIGGVALVSIAAMALMHVNHMG